jgi:hypothetical protein
MVGKHGWNMDHVDVVTAILNPEIEGNDIDMMMPEGWPEGINAPTIVVQLKTALNSLKQAPRLWHTNINTFLLPLSSYSPWPTPTSISAAMVFW